MVNLITKEKMVDTEYNQYHLYYHIHQIKENDLKYYGISISQYPGGVQNREIFDRAIIRAFSEDFYETEAFFETIVKEDVFPVHLYSIADDWYESVTS